MALSRRTVKHYVGLWNQGGDSRNFANKEAQGRGYYFIVDTDNIEKKSLKELKAVGMADEKSLFSRPNGWKLEL